MSNSENSVRRRAWVSKDECPMARSAEIIGDRVVLLVLREAFYGVKRFDDMLQDLGTPKSVLTDRLKRMMSHGLLERFEYQEEGARKRFAYRLTQKGKALAPVIVAIKEWGESFTLDTPSPVDIQHKENGKWLRLRPVDEEGEVADWADVILAKRGDE